MKQCLVFLISLASCICQSYAQQNNVGINTISPDPSAALHIEASDKGILIPRMTSEQREFISDAATGLLVFDTDTGSFWFYDGTKWVDLSPLPANPQTGDITYFDGSDWQRLPRGLAGQALILRNDGTPAWVGKTTEGLLEVILPSGEILYVYPTDNTRSTIEWGGEYGEDLVALPNITSLGQANMDFEGETNTQAIVDQLQNFNSSHYAAKLCFDLIAFGFDDWYLPAAGELHAMYQQLGPWGNNNFLEWFYWSSTEKNNFAAWVKNFNTGDQQGANKAINYSCRCVRK